jgi:hypothetical protein
LRENGELTPNDCGLNGFKGALRGVLCGGEA